jgi:fructokinase
MTRLYGGIEAGGTKFVCAVGTGLDDIREEIRFPTTSPAESIGRAIDFLSGWHLREPLSAIGIASFGPVDLRRDSPTFGYITSTPKPGWAHADFAGLVERTVGVPVAFDTDVNGAALGEKCWGAAQGLSDFLYITVGTGIGGGGMSGGRPLHGLVHPEMGHMRIPHDHTADPFTGSCPYHGNCLEGLASGPAIERRWGQRGEMLPPDHPAWPLEAHYLALAMHNLVCALSPQRIIIGGGVASMPGLLPMMRTRLVESLHGYIDAPVITQHADSFVVSPALGGQAGVLGAIALAKSILSAPIT